MTRTALPAAPFALFDDSQSAPHAARCLLLHDLAEVIACDQAADLETAFARIDAAAAAGYWIALAADYELGHWLEATTGTAPKGRALLTACVFRQAETLDGDAVTALLAAHTAQLAPPARLCGIAAAVPGVDDADYAAALQRILAYLHAGDCYQINYTFPLRFRYYGDPVALYAQLRAAQPVRHGAVVHLPERILLSLSPELFLERRGATLIARPMKGTAGRDADPVRDGQKRDALAASAKERAENLMIVDLIRNDLGRVATIGSVRVEQLFQIEPYRTLWQMTSTVTAEARAQRTADLFRALFPCGSVTGAPKVRAMQIIAELEAASRGAYCGAVGWMAPGGDFSLNVAIRTLVLEPDGRGRMGIGSGVVADSDPAREREECLLKARFLTDLPAPFQLIETLLLDHSDPRRYPRLAEHLRRLAASARYFGFRCDAEKVCTALAAHAAGCPAGRHRVRLLLHQRGEIAVSSAPLAPAATAVGVTLAATWIDSRDLFRYHKTTVRFEYEAELARIAARPELFDLLFCNERGELCEGARTNLFLAFNGTLHTPPLAAGLLDGVMRRELLRERQVVERTIYPEELAHADGIFIANSVRGLLRARLLA